MTRELTLAGYAVIALALVVHEWHARRRRTRATLGRLVAHAATLRQTRWPLLAAWLWFGWHIFTRVHWR